MAKEILKDEILTEEELENVAGGTRGELSCDTKFLNALGVMDYFHEPGYCENHMEEVQGDVNDALKGVDALKGFSVTSVDVKSANTYSIDGKKVSRSKFYSSVCNALGKPDFNFKQYL